MPIEQHPIPQDVAGYKFRLIGDMTVKQFIWLASGIILGLLFYSLPLPFFFKYPLAGLFMGLGAGIAFLPIEGRPMDKWLIAFIKSVYSPTQYTWEKRATGQDTSSPTTTAKVNQPVPVSVAPKSITPVPSSAPSTTTIPPAAVAVPPVSHPAPAQVQTPPPVPSPQPISVTSAPDVVPFTPPKPTQVTSTAVIPKPAVPSSSTQPVSGNLPIPFTPSTPNTLVGMTLTPDGKILDGCLIEIKANNISIRATKSNQLGQFLFAKPLENGQYQIFTEKPGFSFDSYSLDLTGQIVKPLRLQAKTHV